VEVHAVALHTFHDVVSISANILPERQVKILPRVPGELQKVLVEEGDRVEEGQVVAQLDQRDYLLGLKQAQAQAAAARADAEAAAVGVESASTAKSRMAPLHETKAISQSEMDKVDDGYKMGLARQSAAEAQAQLALVGLEAARTKLADTVLRAPFAGVVVKRFLDEGELCGFMPPGIVMIIADVSRMKVMGSVGELHLSRVKAGMPATVRVDALPGESFQGTVEIVSPMVDPMTRTATVHITVPNDEGRLEMGMAATIEIDLGERQVVAVPQDVLARSEADRTKAQVFVVEDGVARRRELLLGQRQGDLIEVTEGLDAGMHVVRSGASGLRDGQRVAVARTRGTEPE
jgi:membrane fusion protein (multidrug efflux system)